MPLVHGIQIALFSVCRAHKAVQRELNGKPHGGNDERAFLFIIISVPQRLSCARREHHATDIFSFHRTRTEERKNPDLGLSENRKKNSTGKKICGFVEKSNFDVCLRACNMQISWIKYFFSPLEISWWAISKEKHDHFLYLKVIGNSMDFLWK